MSQKDDLISRQDAIDAMAITLWYYPNDCYKKLNVYEFAKALAELGLRSLPSADVQPVVHGEWIFDPDGMDWNIPAWVCSECHGKNGMIPTYIQGKDKMIKVEHPLRWAGSNYCPNCGAKMGKRKGADE